MAVLITLIGFGIMVLVHEFGHFAVAKKYGVLVHEFAIGMGPKIFSFGKGETKYSLRLLPLGGYVKLEGEGELEENNNPRSFSNLSPIKRIAVLVSGALMNLLLGILLFTIINASIGISTTTIKKLTYDDLQTALKPQDRIIRLDNTRVHTFKDIALFMSRYQGGKLSITVKREQKIEKLTVNPRKTEEGYLLGAHFENRRGSFFENIQHAIYDAIYIVKAVFFSLSDLITGKIGINSLSGPVEIVSVVKDVTTEVNSVTLINILMLFAMITVNLGVFNLLPFPALDGGSIVFALYELITRKKVKPEIVGYAGFIGFILLMALALIVTVGDIRAIIK